MSDFTVRTTCSYCSVGCNLDISVKDGKASLKPNKEYPVNQGFCCPKGFHLLPPMQSDQRGTDPLIRDAQGIMQPVSWQQANQEFVRRFKAVMEKHGPESVAFLSTGQIPMEEMALLGSVTKFGMGWIHGDGNTRQCMATAAVAYKQAFGFDAPPFTYEDFEESDLLVFVGSNPVINHPIMWNRVKKNEKNPTIVVIDPRKTETTQEADIHLQITPKSDLHLLYGVTRILIEQDWIDHDYIRESTEDFQGLKDFVMAMDLDEASRHCGISTETMFDLARRIHEATAASFWWTMGVNQSHQATRTAQALINIALITHNIGRPGTGANSITGQANAMGSRLYSNTTSLLGGYAFTNPEHREHVASQLSIPVDRIPDKNSLPYHKILEAVRNGSIKGLWIIATNPGHSWINKTEFFQALENLDVLAVQDLYPTTETARYADIYLPAAGSPEKSGTFINSERRIGIVQKALDPPGNAKSDFEIFKGLAQAWGCGDLFTGWTNPEAVFRILQRISKGQPCDISGIEGYQMIIDRRGVQWPYPQDADANQEFYSRDHRRLFEDGRYFTPSGKAQLLYDPIAELPEVPDEQYPVILITGRGTMMQFHTQTRTGKVPFIQKKTRSHAYAQINPQDAQDLGIEHEGKVRVTSRRGTVVVDALVEDAVAPGQIFMPMHYPPTNWLTYPSFDPHSFEPSYKFAAVRLSAVGPQEDYQEPQPSLQAAAPAQGAP
ncbi:molybdopterin oxidoreductase family protein [Spirochaeta lutea]|uniref:molybdopterin oxidoreductase family protein n=1 Tax=Spirochaeta lutea TaxID=1480694 RepID=UPI0009DE4D0A|nr:nitrate reductase [Spirochaeta lutea]